jgi:hypothetical protein
MRVLSIDVGIKNLAVCLFNVMSETDYHIEKWLVVNLCNEKNINCACGKKASYVYGDYYCCKKHSGKCDHSIIPPNLELNKLRKKKINEIREILHANSINFDNNKSKISLLEELQGIFESIYVLPFNNTVKASDLNLVDIGINLKKEFDNLFKDVAIDTVLIENQISPIANRMKTLQGMIAQYFIIHNVYDIHFISASNKLKDHLQKKNTVYSERKKIGIEVCEEILVNNPQFSCTLPLFEKSKKKDDLADCFLQGIWYLKDKLIYN